MSQDAFPVGQFLPNGNRSDPPLPPNDPTIGYKLNHLMLRIRDPVASMRFYIDLMGMRTVFTMNTGPLTIYYLGYPQTDTDRADIPAWGQRTCDNLVHTLGLLELYHLHGSEKQPAGYYTTGNDAPNLGFGQVGFTVPDVPAALSRLKAAGVTVLKDLGVATRESIPLSKWEEDKGVGVGEIHPEYARILNQIAFVADPDGYLVELVPQTML
ncbi:Lactoylglutathione lyase [Drechslerella dactyloides]|uniref:Lactoylglutathione lyase n=1 Tax=Drechslerella dactyloides TaxID=74499 RepID=A0AAD6J677_DREDA|nr:Lactoylglutathione lyase [Drechslerella dactyloides]